jgi:hypothetical protein
MAKANWFSPTLGREPTGRHMRDVAKLQVPRKRGRKREKARAALCDLAPNRAKPVRAPPVPPPFKTKPT